MELSANPFTETATGTSIRTVQTRKHGQETATKTFTGKDKYTEIDAGTKIDLSTGG